MWFDNNSFTFAFSNKLNGEKSRSKCATSLQICRHITLWNFNVRLRAFI